MEMIPKKIHYCWFGGAPLDEIGKKCIDSWRRFFPDYDIIEWNETNFDYNFCAYAKEAYEKGKWAFVSDYARFKILYEVGGLYFDTDVEIVKDMTPIIQAGPYMGMEAIRKNGVCVNPGLGIAAPPAFDLYKEIINHYENSSFLYEDGTINYTTVVERTTDILKQHGLCDELKIQNIAGTTIYPPEYFCPVSMDTGNLKMTDNCYSIHHFVGSWCSPSELKHKKMYRLIRKVFGKKITNAMFDVYKRLNNR